MRNNEGNPDQSLARDLASAVTAEERFDCLVDHVNKLSFDVHSLKGALAANTSITKESADALIEVRASQAEMKESQDKGREDTALVLEIVQASRGAFKFAGWFGAFARWAAPIAAAVIGLWYTIKSGGSQ